MLRPGDKFAGSFTIERSLARRGGQGQVFEVREDHGARWALKVLSVPGDDQEAVLRDLEREYLAVKKIRGDHVVRVERWGVEDGEPWITMELLEGDTLWDHVEKKGALSLPDARNVLEQLGLALQAAHAAGVIHRDVKPANVMLTKPVFSIAELKVKLVDFGIAAVIVAGQTRVNETRGGLGTPEWMAPEQDIEGNQPDTSADVWAYALVAFYALTGKKYWKAKTGAAVILERKEGEMSGYPSASERARELGVGGRLPARFDDWFVKCVAYDPARRGYRDAAQATPPLVALLDASIASEIVTPAPPSVTSMVVPSVPVAEKVTAPAELVERPKLWGAAPSVSVAPPHVATTPTPNRSSNESRARRATRSMLQTLAIGLGGLAAVAGPLAAAARGCVPAWPIRAPREAPRRAAPEMVAAVDVPSHTGPRCPPEMVFVPEATFWMGSAPGAGSSIEQPRHPVHLHAFCIDRTEVTVAAYRTWRSQHHEVPEPTTVHWPGETQTDHQIYDGFCNWRHSDREDHPINCVDWDQAVAYCASMGKRLPSEAEWEYAARGTDGRRYPWGNEPPDERRLNGYGPEARALEARAGIDVSASRTLFAQTDGFESTAPVGHFSLGVSPFGALDMAGNVWEWTGSYFAAYPGAAAGALVDPEPTPADPNNARRVLRGGGWLYGDPAAVSCSYRSDDAPTNRNGIVGFRCARR